MRTAVRLYVIGIGALAAAAVFMLWRFDASVPTSFLAAATCFVALGLVAQALQYRLATGASGSIAFIPFLTIAAIAPGWASSAAVGVAALLSELFTRRSPIKIVFNVAQYVLATSLAIAVYLALGGKSLDQQAPQAVQALLALGGMFAAFMVANWLFVSLVVAIHEGRNVAAVWKENTLSNLLYDCLSLPLLYVFVWVYTKGGVTGSLLLTLPILGLRQLYKTNFLLEQTNQDLLQLMVAAIEARDPYTSGHSKRVAHYSKIIARAIGLTGRAVDRIGIAALLHDVGKIHEAFAPLLRKEGPLTIEERALMETHSAKSAELVSNVSQLKDLVAPIRHHHENWDGSGYPDGVAGEAIPLAARIIMIADTIDAMTTDRPYRKALGPEDVRQELQKWRGKQFDPAIVDVLLESALYAKLFDTGRPTPVLWRTSEIRIAKRASA